MWIMQLKCGRIIDVATGMIPRARVSGCFIHIVRIVLGVRRCVRLIMTIIARGIILMCIDMVLAVRIVVSIRIVLFVRIVQFKCAVLSISIIVVIHIILQISIIIRVCIV